MIWVDYVILGIVALSALIGLFRGLTREAIGLATWVLAAFLAYTLAQPVSELLTQWISVRSVRLAAAFGGLFVVALIIGAIVNFTISKLVTQTGFAGTDRALGAVFGVVRGAAVLVLLVMLAGLTAVPRDQWWNESIFIDHLEEGAVWARQWLPQDLAEEIEFARDMPVPSETPKAPDRVEPIAPTQPQPQPQTPPPNLQNSQGSR